MKKIICFIMIVIVFISSFAVEVNVPTETKVEVQAKKDAVKEANRLNLKNIFLISSCSSCMTATLMSPLLLIAMVLEYVVEDRADLKIKTDVMLIAIVSILIYTNANKIADAYIFKYKNDLSYKDRAYRDTFTQEYYFRIKERVKQTSFIAATISLFITVCALLTYNIAVND